MIILPALCGLLLCLVNASGGRLFCVTAACEIYQHYSLFGLSFYVYGAAGFGLILLLALLARKKNLAATTLLGLILLLGLLLDMAALGWQLLFWPCMSCLVVAALLGAAAGGFCLRHPRQCSSLLKGTLAIWLLLLIPVGIAAGKEVLIRPWAIAGSPDAPIQLFFSPTCPACERTVNQLLQSPDLPKVAFFPIAKNARDLQRLNSLTNGKQIAPSALYQLFTEATEEAADVATSLRWRLLRNKMLLAKQGIKTIPHIAGSSLPLPAKTAPDLLLPPSDPLSPPAADGCGVLSPPGVPCE